VKPGDGTGVIHTELGECSRIYNPHSLYCPKQPNSTCQPGGSSDGTGRVGLGRGLVDAEAKAANARLTNLNCCAGAFANPSRKSAPTSFYNLTFDHQTYYSTRSLETLIMKISRIPKLQLRTIYFLSQTIRFLLCS
jgi:hypothetical protein